MQLLTYFPNHSEFESSITAKVTQVVMGSDACVFLAGKEGLELRERSIYYIKEGIAQFYIPEANPSG